VEGYDDGDADNRHVDGEAQPGEKRALVGAVVAGIGRVVGEEKGVEEWREEERVAGGGAVSVETSVDFFRWQK